MESENTVHNYSHVYKMSLKSGSDIPSEMTPYTMSRDYDGHIQIRPAVWNMLH